MRTASYSLNPLFPYNDIIEGGFYMLHGMFKTYIHIKRSIYVYTVNEWIGTVYVVMQMYEKVNANFGSSVLILYN